MCGALFDMREIVCGNLSAVGIAYINSTFLCLADLTVYLCQLLSGGHTELAVKVFVVEFEGVFLDAQIGHNLLGGFFSNIALIDHAFRLGQLAGLEREKIENEYKELIEKIAELQSILASESKVDEIIKTDLLEIKRKYGDARRTEIGVGDIGIEDEDLIPVEDL